MVAHPQRAEVLARTAELVDQVVQDRTGRGHRGGRLGTAEAVERMHAEVVAEHLPRGVGQEGVAVVGLRRGQGAEERELLVGHQKFRRRQARQLVVELRGIGELGDRELTGRVIHAGQPAGFPELEDRGEVVRPLVVEQVCFEDRAGGNDPGDLAFDDFPRLRLAGLLGDGHPLAGLHQLGDVIVRRMVGHAAHRHRVAAGQRDIEDRRGGLRVVEEHLVEIAQPVEQQHVVRQRSAHRLVLRHHRGERRCGHLRRSLREAAGRREAGKAGNRQSTP